MQHTFETSGSGWRVPLRTGAVATSGTAARDEHVVDPATGSAPQGLLSATVIGPDLMWADVYATAALVLGNRRPGWVFGLENHAATLISEDGTIRSTPNGAHQAGDRRLAGPRAAHRLLLAGVFTDRPSAPSPPAELGTGPRLTTMD